MSGGKGEEISWDTVSFEDVHFSSFSLLTETKEPWFPTLPSRKMTEIPPPISNDLRFGWTSVYVLNNEQSLFLASRELNIYHNFCDSRSLPKDFVLQPLLTILLVNTVSVGLSCNLLWSSMYGICSSDRVE